MPDILLTRRDDVGIVSLNRPEVHNAVKLAMWRELAGMFQSVANDDAVRAIVLTGAGANFCVGADVTEFNAIRENKDQSAAYETAVDACSAAIADLPKPVIAAISGYCLGGACHLALACDFRFADSSAKLGIPAAKLSIVYGAKSVQRLLAVVGIANAKRILYAGERYDAAHSLRIGLGLSTRTDLVPPTITLLYAPGQDSTFQPGDRLTFALVDSSGIDLTRLDNAHTIFTILDDRGAPVELTTAFSYDPGSYTRGTVAYTLPQVPEGLHTIEVHASDTFGNIAVRTFVIDVHSPARPGDPMQLSQVFNYPNPFQGITYIHARLNQAGAIRVQVLTVAGRRIRELESSGRAGENYLPWDGKDSEGENVAIGVYLFKVTAESQEGKRASAVGRALRAR